jgi:hypothetical protein
MERSILGRKFLLLVVLGSTVSLAAQSSFGETTTDCRTSPRPSAPQGTHWYYRVDRTNNRHCWFLSSAGTYLRSHRIVATSNRTPQDPVEQAWTPSQRALQKVSSKLASAGTVNAETPPLEPSVGERTATDFVGRWLDLPNSRDLDVRESVRPRNKNADEHTSSGSGKQILSSWFVAADTSGGLRQSAGTANLGSIFLTGALSGALLFGGVLGLTRRLHAWPAVTTKEGPHDPAIGLGELMGALRRVDETADLSRSLDRWPVRSHRYRSRRIGKRQNDRAFDFAVRAGQHD